MKKPLKINSIQFQIKMKKIIATMTVCLVLFSCTTQKSSDEKPPLYEILKQEEQGGANFRFFEIITEQKEFKMLLNDKDLKRKINPSDINTCNFLLLNMGEKNSGGYSFSIENIEEIRSLLGNQTKMVFVTAGMGGGTGTGAAPIVAQVAKEMGILTVGVISKPFDFEGVKRLKVAEMGAQELEKHVDSLIVVLNEKLFEVMGEDAEFDKAFACADDVLHNAVSGIAEIINVQGLINVDFEDVKTVMGEQGKAMMGTATVSGMDRARLAAEAAVASPLLEGVDLSGARGVLVNITASRSLKLSDT